jgi:hypothetical protein
MCEESAGKRRRRSITPGNRWLKQALVQAAWAASHSKNTYLASQYRRVAGHRGKKRALIAVGHSILVIFYHTIKSGTSHAELGGDFFDRLEPERLARYYLKRLERLGATKSRSNPAQLHERNFRSRKSLYGLPLFEDRPVLRDTTPRTN